MKRKYALVFSIVLLITLTSTACVSKREFEALQDRVAYLESQLGTSNAGTTAAQEKGTTGSNAADEKGVYPLGGLTTDEVVNICTQIMDNAPQKGKTLDEYEASIPTANSIRDEKNGIRPWDRIEQYKGINGIYFVAIDGIKSEMNGTIGYEDYKNAEIRLYIHLTDYSCAESIYDKLCEILSSYYKTAELNRLPEGDQNNKQGTYWTYTIGNIKTKNSSDATGQLQIVTLKKLDDEFELMCRKQYILD